jgi:hypothetical protein
MPTELDSLTEIELDNELERIYQGILKEDQELIEQEGYQQAQDFYRGL